MALDENRLKAVSEGVIAGSNDRGVGNQSAAQPYIRSVTAVLAGL
jgi:hypothetical protein